jgi:hypothetical protein
MRIVQPMISEEVQGALRHLKRLSAGSRQGLRQLRQKRSISERLPFSKPNAFGETIRSAPQTQFSLHILSMKLGFICLNIPGHLNPMTALALQLQARGDDVVFLYSEGGAGFSVAADIIEQSSGVTKNVGRAHA